MEDDQIFIDKFVKKSVKGFSVKPNTSWTKMEMYLEQKGIVSKSFKGINVFKNVKTDIAIISGVLVIGAGIYFLNQGNENQINPKNIIKKISDTTAKHSNTAIVINKESDSVKNVISDNDKEKNNIVKIKVKVPVHKNVIIKKQIIIKDSVNVN